MLKHSFIFHFALLCLILITFGFHHQYDKSAYEITKNMFARTKRISTLTYVMKKKERVNGKIVVQKSAVKLNRSPFKVYIKQLFPKEGVEVLFVEGANSNKAIINPNGFPWINVSLDPNGSTMRRNQHHTILDSGYDLFISILEHLFNKYGTETKSMLKISTLKWNGHSCWVVRIDNPHFKYYNYKIKPGESLISIADKFKISEHMILEKNEEVDDFYDVSAGDIIEIPNDYAPELELYIDKEAMMPLVMKVYDEQGLYEHYEYTNLVVNPTISPEEFTEEYDDYGF